MMVSALTWKSSIPSVFSISSIPFPAILSTNIFAQETEGAKPKKAGKMKKGRNGRQQTSQGGDYKVCSIEGTRASIDKCLDIVKQK